jgi:hypothetical protein
MSFVLKDVVGTLFILLVMVGQPDF